MGNGCGRASTSHGTTTSKSGRPVSVRMGRYGPYAQLGSAEDEEKPKFAGLLPGQRMDEITLEQALELFKLPRELGETADGEPVSAGIGRFGPYVRYGRKYVSLGQDDSPYTVNLARALVLIEEKKNRDAPVHEWQHEGTSIVVRNGRYGPYATDGEINASIPKSEDASTVTLTRVLELLEAKRNAPKRKVQKKAQKKAQKKVQKKVQKKAQKKKVSKKKAPARKRAAKSDAKAPEGA